MALQCKNVGFLTYTCLMLYAFSYCSLSINCLEETAVQLNVTNTTEGCSLDFSDLENGNITIVENNTYRELHFTCLSGYKLIGRSSIVCDGQESDPKPQCVQVLPHHLACGEPPMLANGEVRVEGWREGEGQEGWYEEGVRLEYQCIPGHHLMPPITYRVCRQGRWSGVHPVCQPDGCLKPSPLNNGQFVPVTESSWYPVDTHLHFSCDIGFKLQGVASVQCLGGGAWSHSLPQCLRLTQDEGLSCEPPPLGPHVTVTVLRGLLSANVAVSGSTLQLSCTSGHRDTASPCAPVLLRCVDGSWQGRLPNCVSVDSCVPPLTIPHATVLRVGLVVEGEEQQDYTLGTQVAYSCETGYRLAGTGLLTCRPDGCWDPAVLPVCHPTPSPTHCYMNPGAWGDYIKLNTSLLVSLITVACVSVVLLSVCLVLVCRPHPSPHPPAPLAPPAADPDRVALIAFADGVQSVLPSYEEAVRGGVLGCRLHRPHWTTVLGGQRRNNRQTPSVRDSMGSTDTVTASEVSTNVTVDTVSSHSGSQTASCHAVCGSLASFDTSSVLNTDGVPLLEVTELDERSQGSSLMKLQPDIASIHSKGIQSKPSNQSHFNQTSL